MSAADSLLDPYVGKGVVMDLASPYLVIGTLVGSNEAFIELVDADVHDLRDTRSTRDQYLAAMKVTGVKPNRRKTLILRDQVVSLAALEDVLG